MARTPRVARLLPGVAFGISLGLGAAAAPPAAAQRTAVPEPGVALGAGEALVPVGGRGENGRPVRLTESLLSVEVDGRPLRSVEILRYGDDPEAAAMALFVAVDAAALAGSETSAWAAALAEWASSAGSAEVRAIWVFSGKKAREVVAPDSPPEAAGRLAERLAAGGETRLWDGVLAVLDRLSGPELPARRVLLLVSDGSEAIESVHPVATCADAADAARVAIHVLVPGGRTDGAGPARLRTLAARTGGVVWSGEEARRPDVIPRAIATVREVLGLRLSGLPADQSGVVTVRAGVGSPTGAPVSIQPRRALGLAPVGSLPVIPVILAIGVAGGLGAFLGFRFRPVGKLVVSGGAPAGTISVTRRGVRLGAARGNDLVLDHPRVSRKHAVVKIEGGRAVLVDLRSANGTKVNGEGVRRAVLDAGDRILLADEVELVYQSRGRSRRRR